MGGRRLTLNSLTFVHTKQLQDKARIFNLFFKCHLLSSNPMGQLGDKKASEHRKTRGLLKEPPLRRDTKVICRTATEEGRKRETGKLKGNDFCLGYHQKLLKNPRRTHMCLGL